jgi:molecular chaperone DnaJ
MRGGPSGDLYIFLSIAPHELFQRDGADLYCRVPVAMTEAALGGEVEVPTISGSREKVKIAEGTQSGKQFRIKGKGMPVLRSREVGDLYIQVEVEIPKNLTKRQRELLEEFRKSSSDDNHPDSTGFFTRVKDLFGSRET